MAIKDVLRFLRTPFSGADAGNQAVVDANLKVTDRQVIPVNEINAFNGGKVEDGVINLSRNSDGDLVFQSYADGKWTEYLAVLDGLKSIGGITLDENEVTVVAPVKWRINSVNYQKLTDTVITVNSATDGFKRIDYIYADANGNILLIEGTEVADGNPYIPPILPDNTIMVAPVYISGDTVQQPIPDLSIYITKSQGDDWYIQASPSSPQQKFISINGNITLNTGESRLKFDSGNGIIPEIFNPSSGSPSETIGLLWIVDGLGNILSVGNGDITEWNTGKKFLKDNTSLPKLTGSSLFTVTEPEDYVQFGNLLTRVYYTSRMGFNSTADLSIGSTDFGEDATAKIQEIIDTATINSPVKIIVDGAYSITQLIIPSYVTIEGIGRGSGFIQPTFTNKQMFINANRDGTIIIDRAICIKNIDLNGSGWVNGTFGQIKQTDNSGWNMILRMSGVDNLMLSDISLLNSRTFGSFVNNATNVFFEKINILVASDALATNLDGIKFVGPIRNLKVTDLYGSTIDDLLSIDTEDGFWPDTLPPDVSPSQAAIDFSASYGEILDVDVDKITLLDSQCGIRILNATARMDRIRIANISGNQSDHIGVLIDNFTAGGSPKFLYGADEFNNSGNLGSLYLENLDILRPSNIAGYSDIYIGLNADDISINNLRRNVFTSGERSVYITKESNIKVLSIDGIFAFRNDNINFPLIENNGNIVALKIANANYYKNGSVLSPAMGDDVLVNNGDIDYIDVETDKDGIDKYDYPPNHTIAYKMNGLNDSSGNGLDLTNFNGVTFVTGKIGNAANINGFSGQYLKGRRSPFTEINTATTITGWFLIKDTQPDVDQYLIVTEGTGAYDKLSIYYDVATSQIRLRVRKPDLSTVQLASSFAADNNYHFFSFIIGDTDLKISIDGGSFSSLAFDRTTILSGRDSLFIGANNSGTHNMNGNVDELVFFQRELSLLEVQSLYNGGVGKEFIRFIPYTKVVYGYDGSIKVLNLSGIGDRPVSAAADGTLKIKTVVIPTLQQVATAGNTFTGDITTANIITGAVIASSFLKGTLLTLTTAPTAPTSAYSLLVYNVADGIVKSIPSGAYVDTTTDQSASGEKSWQNLASFYDVLDMRGLNKSIRLYNGSTNPSGDMNSSRVWFNNMNNINDAAYRLVQLGYSGLTYSRGLGGSNVTGTIGMPSVAATIVFANASGTTPVVLPDAAFTHASPPVNNSTGAKGSVWYDPVNKDRYDWIADNVVARYFADPTF